MMLVQRVADGFSAAFAAGQSAYAAKLFSSLFITGLTGAIQVAAEQYQLKRMKRADPPLSHYFPGVEFLLAAVGIVLSATGDFVNRHLCGCAAPDGYSLSMAWGLTLIFFTGLLVLERPPGVQTANSDGLLIPVKESDQNGASSAVPSYRRESFWVGACVLLVVSAFLA